MALEQVKWAGGRKQAFESWIYNELAQTKGDRARLERKWKDLILRLRARVIGNGTSDVPFVGASDLEYPLSSIHFEPVYADLMQTLHVPKDFWSIVAIRADRADSAKPLQKFVGIIEREELGMRQVNERALLDLVGLGTCIYKDYILHDRKIVRDYDETGAVVKQTKLNFRPQVRHIPLQDFWIPAYAWRINPDEPGGAPWVSHYFELNKSQFKQRSVAEAPFLPDYDAKAAARVLLAEKDEPEPVRAEIRREDEFVPFQDRKIQLHEIWARFDCDGDGIDEDAVVVWHQDSSTVLRATYNPFMHGERPFEAVSYIPGFGFYGVGIVEADEWAQLAMTRLLNAALDNTLIANSRMYSVPSGTNVSPDEPIHSGKIWVLGPNEKIGTIEMGEVYPSMFQLMDRFMQWSESRTGVSELRQGNISNLPGRTPASTVMNVLSEGNKKFDMVLTSLRESFSRIGRRVMKNLIQISKTDPRYKTLAVQVLGEQDGLKVVEILNGSIQDIEEIYGIAVTATSSQVNKEVEKQSLTGLAQMISQMDPALIQYAQALAQIKGDPSVLAATIESAYTGLLELKTRVLEGFDIPNADEFIPAVATQAQAAQAGAMGMQQPGPAGAPAKPAGKPAFAPAAQGQDVLSQVLGL